MVVGPYDAKFFRDMRRKKTDEAEAVTASLRPSKVLVPGHEIDPDTILKYTQKGIISSQGNYGSVYNVATRMGWDVKVGESEFFSGDSQLKNGKVTRGENGIHHWMEGSDGTNHFSLNENYCSLNGEYMTAKELKVRMEHG